MIWYTSSQPSSGCCIDFASITGQIVLKRSVDFQHAEIQRCIKLFYPLIMWNARLTFLHPTRWIALCLCGYYTSVRSRYRQTMICFRLSLYRYRRISEMIFNFFIFYMPSIVTELIYYVRLSTDLLSWGDGCVNYVYYRRLPLKLPHCMSNLSLISSKGVNSLLQLAGFGSTWKSSTGETKWIRITRCFHIFTNILLTVG